MKLQDFQDLYLNVLTGKGLNGIGRFSSIHVVLFEIGFLNGFIIISCSWWKLHVFLLTNMSISRRDINRADTCLSQFVRQFQDLYEKQHLSYTTSTSFSRPPH